MQTNKVKSATFMSGAPIDIQNGSVDVFVTLEDDDSKYWLEVTTPQALDSHMDERKQRFLEPLYPFIIEKEDGFCFKLYYSISYLTDY